MKNPFKRFWNWLFMFHVRRVGKRVFACDPAGNDYTCVVTAFQYRGKLYFDKITYK